MASANPGTGTDNSIYVSTPEAFWKRPVPPVISRIKVQVTVEGLTQSPPWFGLILNVKRLPS
jgi:hypothetical protein